MREAGVIAGTFGIDPIAVLDADASTWQIRSAAQRAYVEALREARGG